MAKTLRKLAEGQLCYLRLNPFCTGNPKETVLAHFRIGGVAGTGQKPPDVCGAPACKNCHDVIDGRFKQDVYSKTEIHAEMCRAQNQWLAYLWANEYIIPGGIAA
jgi:hypothetical protein